MSNDVAAVATTPGKPKVDYRQARGAALAKSKAKAFRQIAGDTYLVPSATASSSGYVVDLAAGRCTCPDYEERGLPCKHQWALRYFRHELELPDGTTFVTEGIRLTYPQNWPAYHVAREHEKEYALRLLHALCAGIPAPPKKRGRPPIPIGDAVYAAAMYVYTGDSCGRAMSDIRASNQVGLIQRVPCRNSVHNIVESEKLRPLLRDLVEESAKPLRGIERSFAVDGTGFTTDATVTYRSAKYGNEGDEEKKAKKVVVKMHAMVGVRTNAIVAVDVSDGSANDSPFYRPLLKRAWENGFELRKADISADKAYLSHENLAYTEELEATPYIPLKSNTLGTGSAAMERLYHRFSAENDTFLMKYHLRSNVESTNSAIKRILGGSVRSKLQSAQFNEVLLKALCFNLGRLVHAMFEIGVDPKFWLPPAPPPPPQPQPIDPEVGTELLLETGS